MARSKDETAAKLEGVLPQFVLMVARAPRALAALGVIAAQKVQQVGGPEFGHLIGLALLVNQERKLDARFVAKRARILAVA